jgi:hypothetical protein
MKAYKNMDLEHFGRGYLIEEVLMDNILMVMGYQTKITIHHPIVGEFQ